MQDDRGMDVQFDQRGSSDISNGIRLLPFVVAIVCFVLAIPPIWPYWYYIFLRFIVCGAAGYGAVLAHSQKRIGWVWLLGGVVALFNPLIPVHLNKNVWEYIDIATAALLGVAVYVIGRIPRGVFHETDK